MGTELLPHHMGRGSSHHVLFNPLEAVGQSPSLVSHTKIYPKSFLFLSESLGPLNFVKNYRLCGVNSVCILL